MRAFFIALTKHPIRAKKTCGGLPVANIHLENVTMTNPETKTPAKRLQFQLQFMGLMQNVGREEMANDAYIKAQEIAQEMVEAGL